MSAINENISIEVRNAMHKYHAGERLSNKEISLLLESIAAAAPFLEASTLFTLVLRESRQIRESLLVLKNARKAEANSFLDWATEHSTLLHKQ